MVYELCQTSHINGKFFDSYERDTEDDTGTSSEENTGKVLWIVDSQVSLLGKINLRSIASFSTICKSME